MTIATRPVTVPKGDKPYVKRGSTEARFFQAQSRIARRAQDAQEIQDALDWLETNANLLDADDVADNDMDPEWEYLLATEAEIEAIHAKANAELVEIEADPDPEIHGEGYNPFATLTDEDRRGLTVTQMFYGDYTTDEQDGFFLLTIPGASAL